MNAHAKLLAIAKLPPAERHQALTEFGLNADDPVPGTYRGNAVKDGPIVPIIITREADQEWGGFVARAYLGGRAVPVDRVWPNCAKNPVPKEWHDAYMRSGGWQDEHIADLQAFVDRGAIGGNNPPTDPAEVLRDQIEAAVQSVAVYCSEPIDNDLDAARAQTARSRLIDLAKQADTVRKNEKEPHLSAGRAVDAKWHPIVDRAQSGADAIRKALSDYATASAEKVEAMGIKPAEKATIKGGAGRAASVTPKIIVDKVTDWPALILCMQANEELRELVLKLANKAVAVGATVPGVTTKTVRNVR